MSCRISRSRISVTRFPNTSGIPFECNCSLLKAGVIEIDGREIVVTDCPNNICGCQWRGELNHYILDHQKRCNFQVVRCHCKEEMYKGKFGYHLTSECVNRLVDYTIVEEIDDLYGRQRCPISKNCKWIGTCRRFEEVHAKQCMFQDALCICKKKIRKYGLAKHFMNDCPLRLGDLAKTSFSDFLKPPVFPVIKTTKDKGIQCFLSEQQDQNRMKELEVENDRLKNLIREKNKELKNLEEKINKLNNLANDCHYYARN